MPTLKTFKLLATRPHRYGTRHMTAGEEYEVPIREAVALVATRKARFADKARKAARLPAATVEESAAAKADVAEQSRGDIDALRGQAEHLGIDVDGRWGVARLQYEISKVHG